MSQIPASARKKVHERSNGQCSRCGMAGSQIHHRQRRREGGHAVSNLVLLCGTCHRDVHADPVEAASKGYIISVFVSDTTQIRIKTFAGWALFDDEGGFEYV